MMKYETENIDCLNLIHNELAQLKIQATLKTWVDDFGSYIEIKCSDISADEKKMVQEIKLTFEKKLTETRFYQEPDHPQVDYISLKITYSNSYKQKVWSWMQRQFSELSALPKNVYELEVYHKTPNSKLPALHLLNEALNDRLSLKLGC